MCSGLASWRSGYDTWSPWLSATVIKCSDVIREWRCLCVCVQLPPQHVRQRKQVFFLRYGTGKPISNVTNELDSLQKEYGLPFINSSNARHVIETLKVTSGLDVAASAGQCHTVMSCQRNELVWAVCLNITETTDHMEASQSTGIIQIKCHFTLSPSCFAPRLTLMLS